MRIAWRERFLLPCSTLIKKISHGVKKRQLLNSIRDFCSISVHDGSWSSSSCCWIVNTQNRFLYASPLQSIYGSWALNPPPPPSHSPIFPHRRPSWKDGSSSLWFLPPSCWGQILGRNSDKSLKSFPPCYSQSPLLMDLTTPPPPLEQKWFATGFVM